MSEYNFFTELWMQGQKMHCLSWKKKKKEFPLMIIYFMFNLKTYVTLLKNFPFVAFLLLLLKF